MKEINIIGGGVAGLSLGIGLRNSGVPVTVHEAGVYPRHRVCGEFISGRGQEVLRELGLETVFERAGAIRASTAIFSSSRYRSNRLDLPLPAQCISRWTLDECLRRALEERGGVVRQGFRWAGRGEEPGVVSAAGRRVTPIEQGQRWVGLKVHAERVCLKADLEMHVFENQYVGLCRLKDDRVNICGLFRFPAHGRQPLTSDHLRGPAGSWLRERLGTVHFDLESFCAVAGLSLRPTHKQRSSCLRLGDALTMVPPVSGNGMSMALESAQIASEPLAAYSRGELAWNEVVSVVQSRCRRAFAKRLFWAGIVQRLMFSRATQVRAWCLALTCAPVWRCLFQWTR